MKQPKDYADPTPREDPIFDYYDEPEDERPRGVWWFLAIVVAAVIIVAISAVLGFALGEALIG